MPNFFSNIFSRSPPPVKGFKVERPKTVEQVMGEAFKYQSAVSVDSAFCKKLLKWCANEFSTENMLFLLLCEKYKKTPSAHLFNLIYDDFVSDAAPTQVNLKAKNRSAIDDQKMLTSTPYSLPGQATSSLPTTAWKLGAAPPPMGIFDNAVLEIEKLLERDAFFRLKKAQFDNAFNVTAQTQPHFNSAINYLRVQGITLK